MKRPASSDGSKFDDLESEAPQTPKNVLPIIPTSDTLMKSIKERGLEETSRLLPHGLPDEEKLFGTVTGRLCVSGTGAKYRVSLDEIRRRVKGPEAVNSTILASIIRKAKSASSGESLRDELLGQSVEMCPGKRKLCVVTSPTALLEGEAVLLAADFDKIASRAFPKHGVVDLMRHKLLQKPPHQVAKLKRDLQGARRILQQIASMTHEMPNLLGDPRLSKDADEHEVDPAQKPFNTYALLTHGFGVLNMQTWLRQFNFIIDKLEQDVELPEPGDAAPGAAPPPLPVHPALAQLSPALLLAHRFHPLVQAHIQTQLLRAFVSLVEQHPQSLSRPATSDPK